jgi:adenosylmethionine-8-amino-7-oxononanoate aminotransferase
MAEFEAGERTFVSGAGTQLTDARGRTLFDAISSVWVTVHGHGHPAIVEAIARQAQRLDHATALGATNPVAEELATRLAGITGLDYAFFSSDGASAIEAALKMAVGFWQQAGYPERTKFAHLPASYHGDTAGAMSVSDIAGFKRRFGALTFASIETSDLQSVLERDDIAAIVVEPIVQAAAGMRIVPEAWYAALEGERTPLLIVDEIATGFGRTGAMFAFQKLRLRPDLLCIGKGLTGGALALSATLASERIYGAFLGAGRDACQFFHGHSYAANPIACAAALASLALFESERTLERVAALDAALDEILAPLRANARVRDVRRAGLMCGIELEPQPNVTEESTFAWSVANRMYDRGHFTRPIGQTIQLVPPLASDADQLRSFANTLVEVLEG